MLNKPVGRSMAYRILRKAVDYVGLDGIGTHIAKNLGFHFYLKYKDIAMLREIFKHTEEKIRYVSINFYKPFNERLQKYDSSIFYFQ